MPACCCCCCKVREKKFEHATVTFIRADVLQPFPVAPGTFLLFLGNKEILVFSYESHAGHPGFHTFRVLGSLQFFQKHLFNTPVLHITVGLWKMSNWKFSHFQCRAGGKTSSCRVYANSRRGIVQLGTSLGSIFLLFPMKVAGAHAHSSQGKSPAPGS